jgi:hypothetical protein
VVGLQETLAERRIDAPILQAAAGLEFWWNPSKTELFGILNAPNPVEKQPESVESSHP